MLINTVVKFPNGLNHRRDATGNGHFIERLDEESVCHPTAGTLPRRAEICMQYIIDVPYR
jgi:hypothetical protein